MSEIIIAQRSILETLGEAARAGIITWDSVQAYQARLMPRCVNHPDRSAPVVWGDNALCAECAVATVGARKEAN